MQTIQQAWGAVKSNRQLDIAMWMMRGWEGRSPQPEGDHYDTGKAVVGLLRNKDEPGVGFGKLLVRYFKKALSLC